MSTTSSRAQVHKNGAIAFLNASVWSLERIPPPRAPSTGLQAASRKPSVVTSSTAKLPETTGDDTGDIVVASCPAVAGDTLEIAPMMSDSSTALATVAAHPAGPTSSSARAALELRSALSSCKEALISLDALASDLRRLATTAATAAPPSLYAPLGHALAQHSLLSSLLSYLLLAQKLATLLPQGAPNKKDAVTPDFLNKWSSLVQLRRMLKQLLPRLAAHGSSGMISPPPLFLLNAVDSRLKTCRPILLSHYSGIVASALAATGWPSVPPNAASSSAASGGKMQAAGAVPKPGPLFSTASSSAAASTLDPFVPVYGACADSLGNHTEAGGSALSLLGEPATLKSVFAALYAVAPAEAIEQLVGPVRTRFEFHFCSNRPTNRLECPEWYVAYLRTPLITHEPFLRVIVPARSLETVAAEILTMASTKLQADLPAMLQSPPLLLRTLLLHATLAHDCHLRYSPVCEDSSKSIGGRSSIDASYRTSLIDEECFDDRAWQAAGAGRVPSGLALASEVAQPSFAVLYTYFENLVAEFAHKRASWMPFYDDPEDIAAADADNAAGVACAEDAYKKSVFQVKFEKYLAQFVDLAARMAPELAAQFLEEVAVRLVSETCAELRRTALHTSVELEVLVRMCCAVRSAAACVYEWSLQQQQQYEQQYEQQQQQPEEAEEHLLTQTKRAKDTLSITRSELERGFREMCERAARQVVDAGVSEPLALEQPLGVDMAELMYSVRRAAESATYVRLYRRVCMHVDTAVVAQLTGQPVTQTQVRSTINSARQLVAMFAPLGEPVGELARSECLCVLAEMTASERERLLATIHEMSRDAIASGDGGWDMALAPGEAMRALRNII